MKLHLAELNTQRKLSYDLKDKWVKELFLRLKDTFPQGIEEFLLNLSIEKLSSSKDSFLIKGNFKINSKHLCSRCVEEFSLNINPNFSLVAINDKNSIKKDEEEFSQIKKENKEFLYKKDENIDEDSLIFLDNFNLNLDRLLEDLILLNMPYVLLCKENCKGLCPHCGKNLNNEKCSKTVESFHVNQFAKLKALQK